MQDKTDSELVALVRDRGENAAYGELVRRYQGHAYALAYSILGDWAEAEDMAQEAFINAYVNLHTLRDPAKFPAWLRRIVFSTCMMWLRTFRPELYRSMGEPEDVSELERIPDPKPATPLDLAQKTEMSGVVLAAIDELPPKYRLPLTMFHLDGLSYEKVADFLEVPIGTVKSLIHRARQKLKVALDVYAKEVLPMIGEALTEHKLPEEFAGRVIDGVERLEFGKGMDNQFIAALTVAVRAMGEDVTYDYLMGVSGAAFRFQFFLETPSPTCQDLCPSSADLLLTFNHAEPALKALGYGVELALTWPFAREEMEHFREAAIRSLDKGRPVIADNLMGDGSYGVIAGYHGPDSRFLCRTYYDKTDDLSPAKGWPMQVCIIGEKGQVPDTRTTVLHSIRIGVELTKTEKTDWNGRPQASGFAAFRRWSDVLLRDEDFRGLDPKRLDCRADVNGMIYVPLLDARKTAVTYLRSVAHEIKKSVEQMNAAADIYEKIVEELEEGLRHVVLPRKQVGHIAPWTEEMRHAQAQLIERILPLEEEAIVNLEHVLRAENTGS